MKLPIFFGSAIACILVQACSGSSTNAVGPVPADGGPGVDAQSVDAAASNDDAGESDVHAPLDATSTDSAIDEGGGDSGDNRIDPLAVGRGWTYDVTEVGDYPLCPAGSHTGEVVRASQKDGKSGFEVTSLCANAGSFFYAVDGDVVQLDYEGTWVLALDAPVQEGHTWTNGVTTFAWHFAGQVTVPAGTFSDCWSAQDTTGPSYTVFCRGIGPIHWSFRDGLGNGYEAVLTAKNF